MEEQREERKITQSDEQRIKKTNKWVLCIAGVVFALAVFILVDFMVFLVILKRGLDEGKFPEVQKIIETMIEKKNGASEEDVVREPFYEINQKEELTEKLGLEYEGLIRLWEDDTVYLAKRNGLWGVVDMDGTVIVPIEYANYSCSDENGWVEFESHGFFSVYDKTGTLITKYYGDEKYISGQRTEEGIAYRTVTGYLAGMQVTTYLPETEGEDFYGISYKNAETGESIYETVGNYYEAGIFSLPDKEGRAVAIQGDGTTNTLYLLTKDGCESRTMELPENVYYRYFDFPGSYQWADCNFSGDWLRVYVFDRISDFLMYEDDVYLASLNVETLELVRFPEEYQNFYMMYDAGYGELMAFANYQEGTSSYKYAICKGDRVLTEEKYTRIRWSDRYIVGVTEEQTEILDHEGNVLAAYPMTGEEFVNGKMVVYDGKGVYYIDESLEQCSDYLIRGEIEDCFSAGIIIDGEWYLLEDKLAGQFYAAENPSGATPRWLEEVTPKNLKTVRISDADRMDYINKEVIALQKGDNFTIIDTKGNTLVETEHRYYYNYDEDWICLTDENYVCHVYDRNGTLLYTHNYMETGLTTEEGIVYTKYIQYRRGMRIELDIAEGEEDFYGVHYYNAETEELLFETSSLMDNITLSTMPDEKGTAYVIVNNGDGNVTYTITKEKASPSYSYSSFQRDRLFYYSDYLDWRQASVSDGWVKTLMVETKEGLLDSSENWSEVLYHIKTDTVVPLPEKYQGYSDYYTKSSNGLYYGITSLTEEEYYGEYPETMYYAICHGSEVLTEELYTWITFEYMYILAGNEYFAHILDHEGNVVAEYVDIAPGYSGDNLLVYDGTGAFYIDKWHLFVETGYVMKLPNAYCGMQGVWNEDGVYLFIWEEETEE